MMPKYDCMHVLTLVLFSFFFTEMRNMHSPQAYMIQQLVAKRWSVRRDIILIIILLYFIRLIRSYLAYLVDNSLSSVALFLDTNNFLFIIIFILIITCTQ